jgi:hypothetical protein
MAVSLTLLVALSCLLGLTTRTLAEHIPVGKPDPYPASSILETMVGVGQTGTWSLDGDREPAAMRQALCCRHVKTSAGESPAAL